MSIILDEYEWVKEAMQRRELGRKPSETLGRVAKYYIENKYSKKETRRMLDIFLMQCDPDASLAYWSDALDKMVQSAHKYPLIRLEGVGVSATELEHIGELKSRQIRRLAFTLLCVAKYWNSVSANNNGWVNTADKDLMAMANVSTSIQRQSAMFGTLRELGYIKFSKKIDNLNVQVKFIDDGDPVLFVRDFRNLGYQYLKFYDEAFYECANCGITEKIRNPGKGRTPKYCAQCAMEIQTKQRVEYVSRQHSTKQLWETRKK